MTVYDRPNPGLATETNKLTLHIRPRGFEPLTYGFVGDLTPYVRKCPQAYKAVLTWVSAETTVSSVLRIHACLPPWSPQKSPQSNCIACAQFEGQVENPRSDKFRRCSKGWGASIEGFGTPVPSCGPSETAHSIHRGRHFRAFYWN